MNGLHIVANLYDCKANLERVTTGTFKGMCAMAGFNVVGEAIHQFEPQGTTLTILLGESHLNIHTWPENKAVMMDVYTCNHTRDNTEATKQIFAAVCDFFQSGIFIHREIDRGSLSPDTHP